MNRLGVDQQSVDFRILSLKRHVLLRPDRAEGVDVFVGDDTAFLERRGGDGVDFDLLPTGSDADVEAAIGQHVDRREHLGRDDRRTVRHDHHGEHQPDLFSFRGDPGGRGQLLHPVTGVGGVEFSGLGIGISG